MTERKIKVLVAEDSTVARMLLVHLLESDAQIHVVGAVADGQAALDFIGKHRPDVVVMDIHMPRLDGFEATRRIMETQPVPIVICSATAAVKTSSPPSVPWRPGPSPVSRSLSAAATMTSRRWLRTFWKTVKLMAEVRVVRRTARSRPALACVAHPAPAVSWQPAQTEIKLIGIGASTGGPPVLQTILAGLPKDFSRAAARRAAYCARISRRHG